MIKYPLNFATSFYFLWTFIHAWERKCTPFMTGCALCFGSSVSYYATNHRYIRNIDRVICQCSIVYFLYYSASLSGYYLVALLCLGPIIWLYRRNTEISHSVLHFVANVGVSLAIESCYTTGCGLC